MTFFAIVLDFTFLLSEHHVSCLSPFHLIERTFFLYLWRCERPTFFHFYPSSDCFLQSCLLDSCTEILRGLNDRDLQIDIPEYQYILFSIPVRSSPVPTWIITHNSISCTNKRTIGIFHFSMQTADQLVHPTQIASCGFSVACAQTTRCN